MPEKVLNTHLIMKPANKLTLPNTSRLVHGVFLNSVFNVLFEKGIFKGEVWVQGNFSLMNLLKISKNSNKNVCDPEHS